MQDKQTELHMTGHKKMGSKIPSQAVQDKDTELHMIGHKKMGTKKSKPGSAR